MTLAHIVAPGGAAPDDEAETSHADLALARADRMLREYSIPAALKVNFRVAVGNPAREIAALAREAGAELVVLGAHREDPIPDLFFDTTAYYTMEHCDAPILILYGTKHAALTGGFSRQPIFRLAPSAPCAPP